MTTHKQFQFGDLNPVTHPQTGKTLDPSLQVGVLNLADAARDGITPKFISKLGYPLKAIVIATETGTTAPSEGWLNWTFSTEEAPKLVKIRARIPELHSHLPIPQTFGNQEGQRSIIELYPLFTARDTDLKKPSIGEIVYVDFGDRDRQEDPIYLGVISSKIIDIGTSSEENSDSPMSLISDNDSDLQADASTGDPLGQSLEEADPTQTQVPKPVTPPEPQIICRDTKNPLENSPPSCASFETPKARKYSIATDGKISGTAQMEVWHNRRASNKLVLAIAVHSLKIMETAFIKETGIKDMDVRKFINSGFRSIETQSCYRDKYDTCFAQWQKNGSVPDEKPHAVARPGTSKHNSGLGVDFNKNAGIQKAKTAILWAWLKKNSTKYGWVWAGKNFGEPWHYEFDEKLARKKGML